MCVCLLMLVLQSACTFLGPRAIGTGRLSYSEAITVTNNQQILLAVIRNRYAQSSAMLSVSSVTANVRVSAQAGVQLGLGDSEDYSGNLVPFSAGGVYEENPTISYSPIAGSDYIRGFTAPFSVSTVAQLSSALIEPSTVYYLLVAEMNDLHNPDFLFPGVEPDPRFARAVEILAHLQQLHLLRWVADDDSAESIRIVIRPGERGHAGEVFELLELLRLPVPDDPDGTVLIPVSSEPHHAKPTESKLRLTTRSAYRLLEVLSAAVEPPEGDSRAGVTVGYPPLGPLGERLRIPFSAKRPEGAAIAVPYRGGWFYIDDADRITKSYFRTVETLWTAVLADNAGKQTGPVLTVPVSG